MRRWVIFLVMALILFLLAATTRWWFGPLLFFLKENRDLIQTLDALIQILLALGGILALVLGWKTRSSKDAERSSPLTDIKASSTGSGATALGDQTTAVGEQGQIVEGDVGGDLLGPGAQKTTINKVVIQPPSPPEMPTQDLESAYLAWLLEQTEALTLVGVDSESESRLSLRAIYTALLTLSPETYDVLEQGQLRPEHVRRRSALEEVNAHKRLVVLGDPGSGKSTFVNFITMCLAGERLHNEVINLKLLTAPLPDDEGEDQEQRQPWDHGPLLPVRIVLREFAARGLPASEEEATVEHLWDLLGEELGRLQPYVPVLREHLRRHGGIFLFDGLDEVPEAERRREQILQVIRGVARAFPKCRIVVTSRVYAYRRQDWVVNDFAVTVLAPFSKGQIIRFVDRWYAHTAELRNLSAEDAQGRAYLLKQAILGNERLLVLAERPLLLTLMASLHAWRGGSLPEKREWLYHDMVELLLDVWERRRIVHTADGQPKVLQPSLAEYLKVGKEHIRRVLNELAYNAHMRQPDIRGTADIPEEELTQRLLEVSKSRDANPLKLMEFLRDRAGVIVPKGVRVYAFPHRTFQEYLAACYLTDHEYPYKIAKLARSDPERWREVALLAGAKAGRGTSWAVWSLVENLCPAEPPEDMTEKCNEEDLWGAHIAGQLLVESADLSVVYPADRKKLDRVRQWLKQVLRYSTWPPAERALSGRALAKLGDPREEVLDPLRIEWIEIPAGPFLMGEGKEQYTHDIPYTYWISRYPITNAQFQAFVDAGGYAEERYWREAKAHGRWKEGQVIRLLYTLSEKEGKWEIEVVGEESADAPKDFGEPYNLPNHPVVGITWYEALAFTRWLTERLREEGRLPEGYIVQLPSEAEWEKAARGGLQIPARPYDPADPSTFNLQPLTSNSIPDRAYPWGNDPDPNRANYDETGIGTTSAVGCFPGGASPYGVEEMSGNVWEWTRSLWGKDLLEPDFKYPYSPNDGGENLEAPMNVLRVLRGGSFFDVLRYVRCSVRYGYFPDYGVRIIGFRVVVSPFVTEH